MKKTYLPILIIFSLVWLISLVILISEPYYFHQVKNTSNLQRLIREFDYPNPNNSEIMQHNNFRWNKFIKNINSFTFSLEELSQKPIRVSILSGKVSYKLFYQNINFDSMFSPPQHIYLDSMTWLWQNEEFSCLKISNNYLALKQYEKCKYLSTNISVLWYPVAYPNLYLEITTFGVDWAIIQID